MDAKFHKDRLGGGPLVDQLNPLVDIPTRHRGRPRLDVQQDVLHNIERQRQGVFEENSVTGHSGFWDAVAALRREIIEDTKPVQWLFPSRSANRNAARADVTPLYGGEQGELQGDYTIEAPCIYETAMMNNRKVRRPGGGDNAFLSH